MAGITVNQTEDRKKTKFARPIRYTVSILLCLLSLFPFYVLFINSTLESNIIKQGIHLIPGSFWAANYEKLTNKTDVVSTVSVWEAMLNSLIITVPATILQIYFASLTAYALTVYRFKHRNLAWGFIYAIMMIPTQVSIVGLIKVCSVTNMYGTYWPLIIPAIAAPTTVYFMKQYMESSFSLEIVEAARIDGSNEFRTFNTIAIPLLKPAMATQAIFGFVASWNNLYTPSILLATEQDKRTMPMFVEALKANDKQRDFGEIYMGLFISVIPIMIAYFLLSKYIVSGVALGGVKE
ncbi:MAG TPA: carbohydrate ABC transporter permease [Lachnospiraceae bacterium]|nr:carbohydrate ABC transporter permease [Lachnospiraceae bacterium]